MSAEQVIAEPVQGKATVTPECPPAKVKNRGRAGMGQPRIEHRRPSLGAMVISEASQGQSMREISRNTGVARQTVMEILTRNPEAYLAAKHALTRRTATQLEKVMDLNDESMDQLTPMQRVIAQGILTDKFVRLSEGPEQSVSLNVSLVSSLTSLSSLIAQSTPPAHTTGSSTPTIELDTTKQS